jgi:hypothetical protein
MASIKTQDRLGPVSKIAVRIIVNNGKTDFRDCSQQSITHPITGWKWKENPFLCILYPSFKFK